MKRKIAVMVAVVALLALAVNASFAQSADAQSWQTSITYYTPSDTGGTMTVTFYAQGASPVSSDPITLSPHQAGSLLVSSVQGLPDGFAGGAVMSSEVPVVAVDVQFAANANDYARPLYSGFSAAEANDTFFIATFLYQKFNTNTTMGIQNVETTPISVNVKAYAAGATTPTYDNNLSIDAQSSIILNGADMSLPAGFTGSVVIEGINEANVVASAYEADISGRGAKAFEGVAQGASKVFMPSMLCNAFGSQISYYAIQNASLTTDADVTIDFYNTSGNLIGTMPSTTIPKGSKISVNPCNEGVAAGTSGSAVITSTSDTPIIAIGKVADNSGISTAFVGDSTGSTSSSAAYIRWADDQTRDFRAYVAIMNVGTGTANDIQVKYFDATGTLVETHQVAGSGIDPFIKVNSNPASAGALNAEGNFGLRDGISPRPGGAIEVESDQPVVVVIRMARSVDFPGYSTFAEDYNSKATP